MTWAGVVRVIGGGTLGAVVMTALMASAANPVLARRHKAMTDALNNPALRKLREKRIDMGPPYIFNSTDGCFQHYHGTSRTVSAPIRALSLPLLLKVCNPCVRLVYRRAKTDARTPLHARSVLLREGSSRLSFLSSGHLPLFASTRNCPKNGRHFLGHEDPAPLSLPADHLCHGNSRS